MNKKTLAIVLIAILGLFGYIATIPLGYCATEDMSSAIMEWLPIIIQFAMLGMIMGLLKKMGKW